MNINDVPDFVPLYGEQWMPYFRKWLEPLGLDYFEVWPKDIEEYIPSGFLIATGKSPRGDFLHCVIAKKDMENNLLVVHDPHPDNTAIESISFVGFFVKVSQ